ncbi:MAG TPA: hypothetical protein PKI93_02065 [Alphaproteobacteria bacterium]|nr:hypothetical protein [Alphaproteobacteria bacterium]HNS44922.1 hypothetical protein [Alphaproteobacteria bacterium]
MGSLVSKPKAPKTTTVVVSKPAVTTTNSSSSTTTEPDPVEVARERAENVLRRNRGVWGNVLTGFRGILSTGDGVPQRKTLLGE